MELGLSLGNQEQKPSCKQKNKSSTGLDFSMGLGLNSPDREIAQKSEENDGDEDDQTSEDGSDDVNRTETGSPLELSLVPLAPVPRQAVSPHLQSLPWSSDNGSSENGSSANMATMPAVRALDVNKLPAAALEEVSSANSVGSPFHMDLVVYGNISSTNKRNLDSAGNDVVEVERASSRASDDDENGSNARKKLRLSKEQSAFLEESFKEHNTLNPKQKLALAKQLNLRPRQVEVWFQNRRARTKLKQTEVDCEYLKRCCETLTEENRRLHKELQELRALKASPNPFYSHHSATTLTMCPSCERVAATAVPPPLPGVAGADSAQKAAAAAIAFPLSRPRFYPFLQASTHPNQPAAS